MGSKIKVTFACSENWNNMPKTGNCRFCQTCEKQIIDFTQLNNRQISDYLQQNQNVCGRIKQSQINSINSQELFLPKIHSRNRWIWTIGLGALLGITEPVQAQTNENNIEQTKSNNDEKTLSSLEQTVTITGRVTDIDFGDPISDVLITIENTDIKTYTDKNGKYSLTFDKDLDKETLVTFSIANYKEEKLSLKRISPYRNLKLMSDDEVVIGAIIISK